VLDYTNIYETFKFVSRTLSLTSYHVKLPFKGFFYHLYQENT